VIDLSDIYIKEKATERESSHPCPNRILSR